MKSASTAPSGSAGSYTTHVSSKSFTAVAVAVAVAVAMVSDAADAILARLDL